MSSNLVICVAGGESSGKSTLVRYILSEYLNIKIGQKRFSVDKFEQHNTLIDKFNANKPIDTYSPNEEIQHINETYSCKIYDFLDHIKTICVEIFGLNPEQVYGEHLNDETHIYWENLPLSVREELRIEQNRNKIKKGKIKASEFLQVIEDHLFRKIDPNCLSRGLYNEINKDNYKLAIIDNPKHDSDITMGTEIGVKAVYLTKNEKKLLPWGEYSLVIDNKNLSISQTQKILKPHLYKWFSDKGIYNGD